MATPTKFPAMLQRADGSVAQVNDLNSYNAAVSQGFTFPAAAAAVSAKSSARIIPAGAAVTPSSVVTQPGGYTTTITQTKLAGEQDDGR